MWSWWLAGRARLEWEEQPEIIKRVRKSCSEAAEEKIWEEKNVFGEKIFFALRVDSGAFGRSQKQLLIYLTRRRWFLFLVCLQRIVCGVLLVRATIGKVHHIKQETKKKKDKIELVQSSSSEVSPTFFTDQTSQVQHANRIYETFKFKLRNWASFFFTFGFWIFLQVHARIINYASFPSHCSMHKVHTTDDSATCRLMLTDMNNMKSTGKRVKWRCFEQVEKREKLFIFFQTLTEKNVSSVEETPTKM